MVLASPAVQRLRTRYPNAEISFLVAKHVEPSVRILGLDPDTRVFTIELSTLLTVVRDVLRFIVAARRARIDTTLNLETFARCSTLLCWASGAVRRVGFKAFAEAGLYTGDLLTHPIVYNPHQHMSKSILTLVHALDAAPDEWPKGKVRIDDACVAPVVTSGDEARAAIRARLHELAPKADGKRLIVINPNASQMLSIRKWPLDRYASLVGRLLEDADLACVITGLASERDDARVIRGRVRSDRLIDLTGRTSLPELIDLFNVAEVLVSNDSGPAHFAALTGIHVVVLFGPETPALYQPLTPRCTPLYAHYACSPCVSAYNHRQTACTDNRCLQHFSVEDVYGAVVSALAKRANPRPAHTGAAG